jgi:alanine racemase
MDQMMFDLGDTEAEIGDVITLLNEKELSLDNWAKLLNTINYELTCRLKVRLPRVYTR